MRKILLTIFGFWLCGLLLAARADSFTLTDGSMLSGDVVKSDQTTLMLRMANDAYTNVEWSLLSQDTLKHLAQDPKIQPLVAPFIEPTVAAHPAKPEIKLQDVARLELPQKTSLIGGLFSSSVGLFILFVIYLANLYAGYEIAICRGRPIPVVVGVSALVPFIGPVIFLSLPVMFASARTEEPVEAEAPPAAEPGASAPAAEQPKEDIHISVASWMPSAEPAPPTKPQTEIFQRGKFTFNRRFIETKFPAFVKGTSGDMMLVVATLKEKFVTQRIAQIGPNDMQIICADSEVTVPFADIQEIKLNPKTA